MSRGRRRFQCTRLQRLRKLFFAFAVLSCAVFSYYAYWANKLNKASKASQYVPFSTFWRRHRFPFEESFFGAFTSGTQDMKYLFLGSLEETREVEFVTDQPRNQSTVNLKAESWVDILTASQQASGRGRVLTDGLWMPITGEDSQHSDKGGFVYSAFLDNRLIPPFVRVLGVVPRNTTQLFCKFHFQADLHSVKAVVSKSKGPRPQSETDGNANRGSSGPSSAPSLKPMDLVQAQLEPQWQQMAGSKKLPFLAVFIKCPLYWDKGRQLDPPIALALPVSVSVYADEKSSRKDKNTGNNLRVIRERPRKSEASDSLPTLTYCIRHLKNNYKDIVQLVEFLELYSILGVSEFHFYGHTYSPQVECVLKNHYTRRTSKQNSSASIQVEFHNWELPFVYKKEVTEAGPETAMNDCFFRSTAAGANYVANGDLDEIFLPRTHFGKGALLDYLEASRKSFPEAGAFEFSRIQFLRQFPDDDDELLAGPAAATTDILSKGWNDLRLRVMRKTKVQTKIHLFPKLIVIPDRTVGLKTHWVHSLFPGYKKIVVDKHDACVHHYRLLGNEYKKPPSINGSELEFLLDKTIHAYKSLLSEKLGRFLLEVPKSCNVTRELWDSDAP